MLYLQSYANGRFLQRCINFVEQRLKLSHFEGSIVPSAGIFLNGVFSQATKCCFVNFQTELVISILFIKLRKDLCQGLQVIGNCNQHIKTYGFAEFQST